MIPFGAAHTYIWECSPWLSTIYNPPTPPRCHRCWVSSLGVFTCSFCLLQIVVLFWPSPHLLPLPFNYPQLTHPSPLSFSKLDPSARAVETHHAGCSSAGSRGSACSVVCHIARRLELPSKLFDNDYSNMTSPDLKLEVKLSRSFFVGFCRLSVSFSPNNEYGFSRRVSKSKLRRFCQDCDRNFCKTSHLLPWYISLV